MIWGTGKVWEKEVWCKSPGPASRNKHMGTGSDDVELFSFETLRHKDNSQAASVPKEQRKQGPCRVSNGKRQHPWHQCVIGRRVTAMARSVTEQVQEAECREFTRELIVSFYPKSPRILRNHYSRI